MKAGEAPSHEVGRCSEPGASVMCGACRGITKDEELTGSREVREKGTGWRLMKAGEAPSHCVSPAILTGYRPALTYLACLRSLLRIHNETVNIWSHLLGSIFFTVVLVQQLFGHRAADWIDHTSLILQICSYQAKANQQNLDCPDCFC